MQRIIVPPALSLVVLLIVSGCDGVTDPPRTAEFRGIIAWGDAAAYGLGTVSRQVSDTTGLKPGSDLPTLTPPGLEAPDTVHAGVPFVVYATTMLPSVCWKPGDAITTVDGNLAILEVYDRAPEDLNQPCILLVAIRTREVALQFDQPGEATVRLIGRRIEGNAVFDESEVLEVEQTIVVR